MRHSGFTATVDEVGAFARTYLVVGMVEPFFLENAPDAPAALRDAGADVVMSERIESHGDAF